MLSDQRDDRPAPPETSYGNDDQQLDSSQQSLSDRRSAVVHEWVASRAGSEQTFERIASLLPEAGLYAMSHEPEATIQTAGREIETTFLQARHLRGHRNLTLPIMPLAWKSLRVPDFDVVVTSSHAFARFFPARSALHLSYVYAPMRYAWTPEIDGRAAVPMMGPARSVLRGLDRRTAQRVDHFAGISTEVVDRIRRFYHRDATLIFPPVDLARFAPPGAGKREGFILGVSRWVPYKRLDLVIQVGEQLDMPVVIAGRGPDERRLRMIGEQAKVPVEFRNSPSDSELATLYQRCELLVFPPYEDFGIVPIEAQASGTKVVAFGTGGSRDTVLHGETGVLSESQTLDDFVRAARECLDLGDRATDCAAHAASFSAERFDREFLAWFEHACELAGVT